MTITPIKAIRRKCLDCQGGSPSQVRLCEQITCPLHSYRMGKNPARAGIGGRRGTSKQPKSYEQMVTIEK